MVASVDRNGRPRRRHRTAKRKLADTLLMVFGIPALLFTVLALSVELIEYRPNANPAVSASKPVTTAAARAARDRAFKRVELIAPIERQAIAHEAIRDESIDLK